MRFSNSITESDMEPLNLMECVEIHKPTQQKEVIYTKQMIRDIFMSEYLKQNSIKNI